MTTLAVRSIAVDARIARARFLCGVSAGALALGLAYPAKAGPDPCTVGPGGEIICEGDQSAGVAIGAGTLIVRNTTTTIGGTVQATTAGGNGANGSGADIDDDAQNGGGGGGGGAASVTVEDALISLPSRGVVAGSAGGHGGAGGAGSGFAGHQSGGHGGAGGSGGAATINLNATSVFASDIGLYGYSLGGSGGTGGNSGNDLGSPGVGGAGGHGSTVSIVTSADSSVFGSNYGIYAISAGGSGGLGGTRNLSVTGSKSAAGGGGGSANSVSVTNAADVSAGLIGIVGLALGGSGGAGGFCFNCDGGNGGAGGAGGVVTISNTGHVFLTGAASDSPGIFALSQGGNGGAGGNGGNPAALAAVGGLGGGAGSGNTVTVHNLSGGLIETFGLSAYGILAQSIGGTGGRGGAANSIFSSDGGNGGNGGNGGDVFIRNDGTIRTEGDRAVAVLAQSIGGGGSGGGSASGFFGGGAGGSGSTGGVGLGVDVRGQGGVIETLGADAHGVLAQSIGGGGGVAGETFGTFVALGGTGGLGSDGGTVTIDISNAISTLGDRAVGLFGQSIGGGGGAGAGSGGLVSIGGSGSAGGSGKEVNAFLGDVGSIDTAGDDSHGVLAQSIGGGGGAGGSSAGLAAVGGSGSGAGSGGVVNAGNRGTITTLGDRSVGVFAQSIGGGGGAASGTGGLLAIGGQGGGGGSANNVTVENGDIDFLTSTIADLGFIDTTGDFSHGLFAQSIGGGGGSGGLNGAVLALGGEGGSGGSGAAVTLGSAGSIVTRGLGAYGVIGQSIGGGGGAGGSTITAGTSINIGIGGSGGGGGGSGQVTVKNFGSIETSGDDAFGILAQSVGGGGGAGGFAVGGGLFLDVKVGGSGGGGGTGGNVEVDSPGSITTAGARSHGVFAQSVGGGGGAGGFAGGGSVGAFASASVSVGGSGGSGGNGGLVEVTTGSAGSGGSVETSGSGAHGVLAQSVGGGGGAGGSAFTGTASVGKFSVSIGAAVGANAGAGGFGSGVDLDNYADVSTAGDNAHGLVAQSIGGGGGDGGYAVALAAGGSAVASVNLSASVGGGGGAGGAGGVVEVFNYGDLFTQGLNAHGLLAQSVGGGGGNGGFSVSGTLTGAPIAVGSGVSLGGGGGLGGAGDAVNVTSEGLVATLGDYSYGLIAQSVGGGGGAGGWSGRLDAAFGQTSVALGASLGGFAGGGGDGKGVSLTINDITGGASAIVTQGVGAMGAVAQSIGGGGGVGGFSIGATMAAGQTSVALNASLGGTGGDGGSAGAVMLDNSADVLTFGANAHALVAQSIGGGGGAGGWSASLSGAFGETGVALGVSLGGNGGAGGAAGGVDFDNVGFIETQGDGAYGLLAQSIGGGGGAGGFSISGAVAAGQTAVGISASLGGCLTVGCAGGSADIVDLFNTGGIVTHGDNAHALVAQSVGGGGGAGGFSAALGGAFGDTAVNVGVSLGGNGGTGGDGGDVFVDTDTLLTRTSAPTLADIPAILLDPSLIATEGADSIGVLAQSIGGGGGAGGFSITAGIATGTTAVNVGASLGGCLIGGCAGGAAGDVSVGAGNDILTLGDRSHALVAQSIGGGGGNGGFSATLGGAIGEKAVAVSASLGGNGGDGGDGGDVSVDVEDFALLYTEGYGAHAILAQSIGGGGGDGGFSLSAAFAQGEKSVAVGASLGGCLLTGLLSSNCGGGDGASVEVGSGAEVHTFGDGAHGIVAQSIGGGGGNGGFSGALGAAFGTKSVAVSASLGGNGGQGGHAGPVFIDSTGSITTRGDDAAGIVAQSIGGGGGDGGFSISGALSGAGEKSVSVGVSLGGCILSFFDANCGGGSATALFIDDGDASDTDYNVEVRSSSSIRTFGDLSYGILAQSIGGGGGNGGASGTIAGTFNQQRSVGVGVSLGGFGGKGGESGSVFVMSDGEFIATDGDQAHGILAQSVGGGGGAGGFSMSAAFGGSNSVNVGASLGGFGGPGAMSGDVFVESSSLISTLGDGAHGVIAQSIGGGGGVGGSSGAFSLSIGTKTVNVSANIGGFGGTGADAGDVDIDNSGDIATAGEAAYAIFAESIGGGGGRGGMAGIDENEWLEFLGAPAGSVSFGPDAKNISVAIGGYGGVGGNAGNVDITNSATLATTGALSHVIFAQSIGGGGGDGGVATSASGSFGGGKSGTFAIAVGGCSDLSKKFAPSFFSGVDACAGGDGGAVNVENAGNIFSFGDGSIGIFAQSIGGGGGNGGDARGYALSFTKKAAGAVKSQQVSVSIGGEGGGAGHGGPVTVTNSGAIVTAGGLATGIFAQSVGGGGGTGGLISTQGEEIVDLIGAFNKGEVTEANIALGGSGGMAGDGGDVTVVNEAGGVIVTSGLLAHGIFAQSVGGGGGVGGSGLAGTLSIGGFGGGGGLGGDVLVDNKGTILTQGDLAVGIYAQSIGGGGGSGGAADYDGEDNYQYRDEIAIVMEATGSILAAKDLVEQTQTPDFGVSFGGFGGLGSKGGTVTVLNSGDIFTSGVGAFGIFAQSVGGGGGEGGKGSISSIGQFSFVGVGAPGADGGDVIVTHTGNIVTAGYGSYGIFAQSVGGGGGLMGDMTLGLGIGPLEVTIPNPFALPGGDGGDVTVNSTGNILVLGPGATAIFAQSVGGGGGLVGSEIGLGFLGTLGGNGQGGKVTVTHTGDLMAPALNGVGALFQSVGGSGRRDIVATIDGHVFGGSFLGKGVWIDGGLDNTINLMKSVSAASNLAIFASDGNDTINSHMLVVGNVDLGAGLNRFNNLSTAEFRSLDYINLGGGVFANDGVFQFGANGDPSAPAFSAAQVTTLNGDFNQSSTGSLLMDVSFGGDPTDRLDVTGTSSLGGALHVTLLSLAGSNPLPIVVTGGGVTDAGMTVNDTLVLDFGLQYTADTAFLTVASNFEGPLTRANHIVIGEHLNAVVSKGGAGGGLGPLLAELGNLTDADAYRAAFDSLSPELYLSPLVSVYFSGEDMADAVMSCAAAGVPHAPLAEEECAWLRIGVRSLDRAETAENYGFNDDAVHFSGGVQRELAPGLLGGFALGWERHDQGLDNGFGRADGDLFQAAASLKRIFGSYALSGSVAAGKGDFSSFRRMDFPAPAAVIADDIDVSFVTLQGRAAALFEAGAIYFKPLADVSVTHARMGDFVESGPGGISFAVLDSQETLWSIAPALEVGMDREIRGGAVLRPWLRAGAAVRPDGEFGVPARFTGAPAGVDPFTVTSTIDEVMLTLNAGVDVLNLNNMSVSIGYEGEFGEEHQRQGGKVKVGLKF